jgi:sporulation protein YlmC with PRC-barrel domain
MPVDATDGRWGELDDIVVDPRNWTVTHLVVQPHRHHELARLVPVAAISQCDDRLDLSWSSSRIRDAAPVERTDFLRIDHPKQLGDGWRIDAAGSNSWPFYPGAGMKAGFAAAYGATAGSFRNAEGATIIATKVDRVPPGTVEIRRASEVVSSDDHVVGHVDGFVFDPGGGITHLVLDHGHLWGHRDVTIPLEHVVRTTADHVHLDVTKGAIGDFPSVDFRRPSAHAHAHD